MDAENITPPPSWSRVPDSIWLEILGHLDSAGQLVSLIEQYRANKEDSTHKRYHQFYRYCFTENFSSEF